MEFDSLTGQSYDRARSFDSGIGRFLTQDPSGFNAGQVNLYEYVGDDPLNGIDPTGQQAETGQDPVDDEPAGEAEPQGSPKRPAQGKKPPSTPSNPYGPGTPFNNLQVQRERDGAGRKQQMHESRGKPKRRNFRRILTSLSSRPRHASSFQGTRRH